jgi:RNA polymerase sigma-70 factor (ECF subfamily)
MNRPFDTLITQARAGHESALGQLLQSYSGYLTLMARVQIGRRLQRKVDAADVIQETFLEAHRQFPQFRGSSEPELAAWLRAILAGKLALLIRQFVGTKGRDIRLEQELGADLDHSSQAFAAGIAASGSTPSQQAVRREQAVLLSDALDALPDSYREVIILRHLESLPFAEVAARMGRSEDSVQKLWVRALAALRQSVRGAA